MLKTKLKFNGNIFRRKLPETLVSLSRFLFLGIVGYIVLYPLLFMFVAAIKDSDALLDMEHMWVPVTYSFKNFKFHISPFIPYKHYRNQFR